MSCESRNHKLKTQQSKYIQVIKRVRNRSNNRKMKTSKSKDKRTRLKEIEARCTKAGDALSEMRRELEAVTKQVAKVQLPNNAQKCILVANKMETPRTETAKHTSHHHAHKKGRKIEKETQP